MSFAWIVENGTPRAATLAEADAAYGTADFIWAHLDIRNAGDMAWLAGETDLPDVARAALVAQETRPRCDPMDSGALVNLRGLGATPGDDPDPLVSIRIWAERGWVTSVCLRTPQALEPLQAAMAAGKILDPGDLISTLAILITEALNPDVAALGDLLDDCEVQLDAKNVYQLRRRIARARVQAISYRRFVAPQRQALERLAGINADWMDENDRLHLREAADRCARMAEELEAVRERAGLMHEELTDLRSEQMDKRALMISIVAFIFLPLTFLTGLLGMNVDGIPFAHESWAFWGVVIICVILSALIAFWFVARHWISR
ncbi:zinc transporter ZntB [Sphingomonas sp. C3-2]|uniref:zinc transporter ZntB n=1 Tax=Sphingomonas sp. C3-2 TaxID=3062169 RepID=UPI00294AC934|nr:zinc transporter ZntB [Sphingomonas sp. C3-2]WOK38190.1 zinc transporter ZntB [Sphingomonas sp. C3-2]